MKVIRTLRILSIRSRHFSNESFMSCPTVLGVGMDVLGRPGFINWMNSLSLTRCIGRLLAAHHLAMCALNGDEELEKYLAPKKNTYLVLSAVCARWLINTEAWPSWANEANIEPSGEPVVGLLKAVLTASAPKQRIAWVFKFEVAARSFESW